MPELNIEEKIQEALKRKSFKDNKLEYLGLGLIFCLMLFVTFLGIYFLPYIGILIILFVDIPLIMGFKHFIWFGPASGETLIDGFKVSMICGYLNFVSYMKIFFTTNLRALLWGFVAFFVALAGGGFIMQGVLGNTYTSFAQNINFNTSYEELQELLNAYPSVSRALYICIICALIIGFITYYILKLNRALVPYISFLRLTNLEGKSMSGVLAHTKKIMSNSRGKYYLMSTLYHLLYLIPIGVSVGMYFLLGSNPVYSQTTISLLCILTFCVTMFPAVLFIELNYRNFCIEINQQYIKEHKKMLNDALNDLDKNSRQD